ncbi:MAG: Maf family protein [Lentisphaeraceae bacterium]|nr:Maf family protein [Lentisphaeraceae bacterium]
MDKKTLKKTPAIILASSSPRRQKILRENNINFSVIAPEVEEVVLKSAKATVLKNASLKAEQVFEFNKDKLIIASDTVVSLDDKILGKPKDLKDAVSMLKMLSGKKHEVLTGVSLRSLTLNKDFYETTEVHFKDLTDNDIEEYFSKCNPLDKAGAYNIDEYGDIIIKEISGSYSNVMGLPIETLLKTVNFDNF